MNVSNFVKLPRIYSQLILAETGSRESVHLTVAGVRQRGKETETFPVCLLMQRLHDIEPPDWLLSLTRPIGFHLCLTSLCLLSVSRRVPVGRDWPIKQTTNPLHLSFHQSVTRIKTMSVLHNVLFIKVSQSITQRSNV